MTRVSATGWRRALEAPPRRAAALHFEGRSICYAELLRDVDTMSNWLAAESVLPGSRVGLLAPPTDSGVALIHAMLDSGIVLVPLNLRWTRSELRDAAESADLDWIVVATETLAIGRRLAEEVDCGLLRLFSSISTSTESTSRTRLDRDSNADDPVPGIERLRTSAIRTSQSTSSEVVAQLAARSAAMPEAALILFTSGTSGRSKAAVLSLANLRASALASIELLGSDPQDRWLCCMPLFHIGGLSILIRSVLAGSCVVLHAQFDAQAVAHSLEQDGITRVSLVAAMLGRLLDVRGGRPAPPGLQLVLLGGGPATQILLERARTLGYPVAPTYGLTEAASQVATRPPEMVRPRRATGESAASGSTDSSEDDLAAGLVPLPGTEIRIVTAAGQSAAIGEIGEIEVRGPIVMQGYLGDAAATARALRDGWLATGDLGRLDAEGRLRVLDRRSDLIVSGGENVYPAEIEAVVSGYPAIAEVGVVGIEDAVYGERPCAFFVAVPGQAVDTAQLLAFSRERLAGYKLPIRWIAVDALPRTASGKLLRRELKARVAGIEALDASDRSNGA